MIYDHETEITHESASTYFQCGVFLLSSVLHLLSTYREAVWKDGAKIS